MLKSKLDVWCRCLLLAGAWVPMVMTAQTETPAPAATATPASPTPPTPEGWKSRLADPEFRQRAEQADGVSFAMKELAEDPFQVSTFYDWLRETVKTAAGHQIECLLMAQLARDLERPNEEISAADDLVLQAAPSLPQGWFGRAEQYESGKQQKESAVWAAEAAVQGMRRVNLASPFWKKQLHGYRGVDWLAHADKANQLTEWVKAVASAVEDAPHGKARPDVCSLVLGMLRHDAIRKEPLLGLMLLEAVQTAQPQLVLGDPANFVVVMHDLQAGGHTALAQRVARLLVYAPVPQDSETELMGGMNELLGKWEDTTPPYQATTKARLILQAAMTDDVNFAETCLEAAKAQPKNENLVTHALLALALSGGVSEEQLQMAESLGVESRARVALRLAAFAPTGSHPRTTGGPWMEELALNLVKNLQMGEVQRSEFESLLNCLESLERSGEKERVARVLDAVKNTAPRLNDLDHWERYAKIILQQKRAEQTHVLATSWSSALDQSPEQKEHLLPLARTAIRAGKNGGVEFATMALTLWERHHAEMTSTALPPTGTASRVGEALMACDYVEGFERFVTGLENLPKHRITTQYTQMTTELVALRDLIAGKGELVPAVEAWVRPPAEKGEAMTVQWQLVLPELGKSPERGIIITVGDRDGRTEADKLSDARWWRAGTYLPALSRLSGKFSLEVLAGDTPKKLRSLHTIEEAPARGAQEIITLPPSGSLKVMLRWRENGMTFSSEPRAFSTHGAVFETTREPVAVADGSAVAWQREMEPQPASWQPEDANRWGRLIGPPVEIEKGAEYLLNAWPDAQSSTVRMILLDAEKKPLGPVPVASMGWQAGKLTVTHTPVNRTARCSTQRFRPSDWAGDGDLVFPSDGRAGEQPARYMAFVTRDAVVKTLPALQLRPYRTEAMTEKSEDRFVSNKPELPELNDEYIGYLGFTIHSWHVTFACDRGILMGKGALAGFDVTRIPWKPLVRAESELMEGNEWPLCFTPEHSLVIEPSWNGNRTLGLRFVPFDARGERYAACRRLELPLPNYNRGELSEWHDGAVLMVSSQDRDNPEPACAWVEPDGRCHVVKLPRPPITGNPGMELAWWMQDGTHFTLHEDGLLFHMEHKDGLKLLSVEPGSPDDMPKGGTPGRNKRKRAWKLERPDVLIHVDKKSGVVTHRYHLPKPCEGLPMAFESSGYVILFTTEHEIIRVNPPDMVEDDD